MTRLVVTGGRNFGNIHRDREFLCNALYVRHMIRPWTFLIQGCSRGADMLAWDWFGAWGIPTSEKQFQADWNNIENVPKSNIRKRADGSLYNVAAGFDRNQQMIDLGQPEACIAFRGGNGTADMVDRVISANRRGYGIELIDLREMEYDL